jgi:hypothetical protein
LVLVASALPLSFSITTTRKGAIQLFAKATRFLIHYRVPLFAKQKEKDAGRDGVGDDGRK